MAATTTPLRAVPEPGETQRLVASSVEALADITGITHAQLAEMASIDATKLSKSLGNKRRLTLDEMSRLAAALDVPVMVLYDGGEEIRRRARAAVVSFTPKGDDDPGGLEVSRRGCNGAQVLDFRARAVRAPASAVVAA